MGLLDWRPAGQSSGEPGEFSYIYMVYICIYIYMLYIYTQYANTYIYIQLRLHCQVRSSYDVIFTPVSTLESTKTSLVALIMEHLPLL